MFRSTLAPLGLSLALTVSIAACGSAPPKSSSGAQAGAPSLAGDGPWTVDFVNDACSLSGSGALAAVAKCDRLGALELTGDLASAMGQKVAALTVREQETAGGAVATLSTSSAVYQLEAARWEPLLRDVTSALTAARTAEREARFAGAPSCPAGQVLLDFNSCPGNGTVADVCGAPAVSCGAPVATGGACLHDGACASKKCGFLSAVCEP